MAATSARHHAEWLSLIEVSGPFVSLPVLNQVFPQGLDAHDPAIAGRVRQAFGEWAENRDRRRPDRALHDAWIRFVLRDVLEWPDEVLREGPALPPGLEATFPEHGETLRPTLAAVEPTGTPRADKPRVVIVVYPPEQELEKQVKGSRWAASPATRLAELLRAADVRIGLVTNGERWMLVYAPRGETAAFVSWYAPLWLEEQLTLRAFRSLLGVHRLLGAPVDQTLEAMLAKSKTEQAEVTDALGAQVRRAVELLVQAIDGEDKKRDRALLEGIAPDRLYEAAITVMMRLVFLLFAEEQRPPLFSGHPLYDAHYAVSTLRGQLREAANQGGEEVLERRHDAWSRLLAAFRLVHGGSEHEAMRLPAYGGSLFDPDRFPFLEGRQRGTSWREAAAEPLPINNRTVLHLLDALQELRIKVGRGAAETRRLSFRALDVEQIGHVYESLLDHTAKRAGEPMLGLVGSKEKEPEVALGELERLAAGGEATLLDSLKELTGRSGSALKKDLADDLDLIVTQRFRAACDGDDALWARVRPFAGLVRRDDAERPVVIAAGSVYVTTGTDRRTQGAHYTPRSLTEPIVQHALEPLVYIGPAEGKLREEWRLHTPKALLALKIRDPAMGSGAFLVQTCRYLSERLVEAWEEIEASGKGRIRVTPEGEIASGAADERILPADSDERLALARRLVVDHCLYGVDKNPLAVEMAKLSLWLVTLKKDRPFTFLDHALRCGDSLLGIADIEQLTNWSLAKADGATYRQTTWFTRQVTNALDRAIRLRAEIAATPVEHAADADDKRRLLRQAEQYTGLIRHGSDLLVASALHPEARMRETLREQFLADFSLQMEALHRIQAGEFTAEGAKPTWEALQSLRDRADALLGPHRPFHWPLEFPEVFVEPKERDESPGFAAIVGNPPFQSGKAKENSTAAVLGEAYVSYLEQAFVANKRSADLCAYFFFRARVLLNKGGCYGLTATNTIAEGSTREVALSPVLDEGGSITRAVDSMPWPGSAAVLVSVINATRHPWSGIRILNNSEVNWISDRLDPHPDVGDPYPLAQTELAFHGTKPRGNFFVPVDFEPGRTSEHIRLHLAGEDINATFAAEASRRIIHLPYETETEARLAAPEVFQLLRKQVYEYRQSTGIPKLQQYWWRYEHEAAELYEAISRLGITEVFAACRVANTFALTRVHTNQIFADMAVVFLLPTVAHFATLQSSVYQSWIRKYCSTFKQDIRFNVKDVFINFPFPRFETGAQLRKLEEIGESYLRERTALMRVGGFGMARCYRLVHDPTEKSPSLSGLRSLHETMDMQVMRAFGWDDQCLDHGFYDSPQGVRFTISEAARREVLDRLLRLNHERYAEEVKQGLHEKGRGGKATRRRGAKARGQSTLAGFD